MNESTLDFKSLTESSSIITVTHEEFSEAKDSYKVVLRVLNPTKWKPIIHKILLKSHEEETFGVSVRQEFYLNADSNPSYVWSMLLWGDVAEGRKALTPILERRGAPPPPPKNLGISAPVSYDSSKAVRSDGSIVTTVPLPHKRGSRDGDTNEVIKIGEPRKRKIAAVVKNIGN